MRLCSFSLAASCFVLTITSVLFSGSLRAQCANSTTAHLAVLNLSREAGNSVLALAGTQTVGDYWERWDSYVQATEYRNYQVVRSGNHQVGYGGIASLEWHDAPSSIGTGTYALYSYHRAESECGDATDRSRDTSLIVSRPSVTKPLGLESGIWWLGGASSGNFNGADPDNGFFNTGTFTGNSNCGGSDVCDQPTWVVTAGSDKLSLSCTNCTVTTATSLKHSQTVNDIQIRFFVGGANGLGSDPVYYTVNYPKEIVYQAYSSTFPNLTVPFNDGYVTTLPYKTLDMSGYALPRIAYNEVFSGEQRTQGTNWPSFVSKSFPFPPMVGGTVWQDRVSMWTTGGTLTPTPIDNPNDSNASSFVQSVTQKWYVACCPNSTTTGFGVYLQYGTLQRNRGYAEIQNITPVPVP